MTDKDEKELKTIKFQMMLSPSEAEQIDEWSFGNRIRSRAEAIRRLCQIAMLLDGRSDRLNKISKEIGDRLQALDEFAPEIREMHASDTFDSDRYLALSGKILPVLLDVTAAAADLVFELSKVATGNFAFRDPDDFDALRSAVTMVVREMDEMQGPTPRRTSSKFKNT